VADPDLRTVAAHERADLACAPRACHTGSARATTLAWTLAPVYLVYSITGGFSIAAGPLPAAMLIFVAVALTPRDVATNARPTTH
jgi:hypothetical protein